MKTRWLPIVGTSLLASACGILLGMLVLSLMTNTSVQADHNITTSATEMPKVVQASQVNDKQPENLEKQNLEKQTESMPPNNPLVASQDILVDSKVPGNTVIALKSPEYQTKIVAFPATELFFVQAGVFNDGKFAQPIANQFSNKNIKAVLIAEKPTRLMVATALTRKQSDLMAKQLADVGAELYVKDLEITPKPTTIHFIIKETVLQDEKSKVITEEMLARTYQQYVKEITTVSHELVMGRKIGVQGLLDTTNELQAHVEELLAYPGNEKNEILVQWNEHTKATAQLLTGQAKEKSLGWKLQEQALLMFKNFKVS
ncbi:hypothetical protein BHU72_12560 [Desulfuribacillus stibiiarsenatis]|uniref:SPOR domain-containing protein n=1 Tax=Desulfuribacillus stibiiarsenatis TaxID=1390249 RepID=A0A1E5L2R7_9FIRM|nr:hypothetical protein [Desulfuribacillus stibiiarsenatis]OEH84229.1 hypothetical protein BHU72_12560 [Desulfuribacillus stibiiarsenatis]